MDVILVCHRCGCEVAVYGHEPFGEMCETDALTLNTQQVTREVFAHELECKALQDRLRREREAMMGMKLERGQYARSR